MKPPFRAFLKTRRANAATEFALILPILLLFTGGIVEFGRLFLVYNEANRLANRYAISYADCNSSASDAASQCSSNLQTTFASTAALNNIAPQLTAGSIGLRMFWVSMSAAGTPKTPYNNAYPTGATFDSPTVTTDPTKTELQNAKNAILNSGVLQATDVVVVTVTYQHQLLFFSQIMKTFIPTSLLKFTYTVAQRKM